MQVPVRRTPGTQVSTEQLGYVKPVQPLDLSPITQPMRQLAARLEGERNQREELDLQKALVDETNSLSADFEQRKTAEPLGAAGFTDTVLNDYTARHQALMQTFAAKHYNRDLLNQFDVKLATLREHFGEQALAYQQNSVNDLANKEVGDLTTSLSQYAKDPQTYQSAVAESDRAWDNYPGIDASAREAGKKQSRAIIRQSAAKMWALSNPEDIIATLDPQGLTAPVNPRTDTSQGTSAYGILKGWQSVPQTVARQLGLDPNQVAAVMSFETGGKLDPNTAGGDGGKYVGFIQMSPDNQRKYGIHPNMTPEDWSGAILKYMDDRGFKKGMGLEDFYSTILTGSPGHYDRKDSNGTTVRNAIPRILGQHLASASAWMRSAEPMDASANNLADESDLVAGGERLPVPVEGFDPGQSSAEVEPPVTVDNAPASATPAVTPALASGKTGNPLLDDLNGAERLQVLGWAREKMTRDNVQVRGSMDVAISNAKASIVTGEYAGPRLTKDQVLSVYGPVEGPQKWAEYQGSLQAGQAVARMKTMNPASIQAEIDRLKPNPHSETYAQDVERWQGARNAANALFQARQEDPASYVASAFPEIGKALSSADTPEERKAAYAQLQRAQEQLGIPASQQTAWTDAQAHEMANQYNTASADGKYGMLLSWMNEMGGTLGGRTLGKAAGGQIADDLTVFALMKGNRTKFDQVMQGMDIIKNDPARRPSTDVMNGTWDESTRGAINNLNPSMSRMLNEATAALYVYYGGRTKDGVVVDQKLYERAMRIALGGNGDDKNSGAVDFSKGAVKDMTILPTGINRAQFENWQESLQPGDLTKISVRGKPPMDAYGRPITLQKIQEQGVFVMVAPGVYAIKMSSDGKPIGDATGAPFYVRISPEVVKRARGRNETMPFQVPIMRGLGR